MPTRTVGRYRLIKQLGVGMFSKVMLGIDEETGLEYAVKVMRKDSLEEMDMARYARREAAVLRKLSHRNIVSFIEAIQSDTKLFLVMEVVHGCELLDIVKRGGALGEVEARCYIQQLVDAVTYLHSKGVVHRDLKPDNVLVDVNTKCLKIIDFGLTGVVRKNHVMKTCCGSTYYSAPEVTYRSSYVTRGTARMGNYDSSNTDGGVRGVGRGGVGGRQIVVDGYDGIKADAWSLGILAYILLTGCHPFVDADGDLMTIMLRQGIVEYPDYLSRGAVHFMSRLLTIDPRKRYSVAQVSLHPWLTGKPVTSSCFSTSTMSSVAKNGGGGSVGGGYCSTGSLTSSSPTMVMNTSVSASNVMQRDRPRKDTDETFTFGAFRSSGSSKRPNTFNGSTPNSHDLQHQNHQHNQQDEQRYRQYHQREQQARQAEEEEHFRKGQQPYRSFFGRAISDRLNQSSSNLAVRRRSTHKNSSGSFLWFRRQNHSQQHAVPSTAISNSIFNATAAATDDATDQDTSTGECAPLSSLPPKSNMTTQVSGHSAATNCGNTAFTNDQLAARRGSLDRPRSVREGRVTLDFINARAHHDSMDSNPRVRRQLSLSNRTKALLMRSTYGSTNPVSVGAGGGPTMFPTATAVDS